MNITSLKISAFTNFGKKFALTCLFLILTLNIFAQCTNYTSPPILSGTTSICIGPVNLTFNVGNSHSPFTLYYTAHNTSTGIGTSATVTGLLNGSTISVNPTATTYYQIDSVKDASGCVSDGNLIQNPNGSLSSVTNKNDCLGALWTNYLPTASPWTLSSAGDGWVLKTVGSLSAFCTSYSTEYKYQTVDLISYAGYQTTELDALPYIFVSDDYMTSWSSSSNFGLLTQLRNTGGTSITSWSNPASYITPGNTQTFTTTASWQTTSNIYNSYSTGVRSVYFEDGGSDAVGWCGYYGSLIRNSTVKVDPVVRIISTPPVINSATTGTICSGVAQNYTITSTVIGTTYSWSRAAVTGISNAAVSGQTSNPITETLTNITTSPVSVIYLITPTANGCTGNTFTYTVTVKPNPSITSSATGTICSDVAQNYTITSNVSGTTYSWSRAAVAGISNSAVSGQTSNPITETLTNTTNSPVNVIYLITPTANSCAGTQFPFTVTVNPTPTISSSSTGSVCSGLAENYTISSGVSGTTFSWSRAAVAGVSNTTATAQTSNPITEILNDTTISSVNVIYLITLTANSCTGSPFTYTVTVNPVPVITTTMTATICSGVGFTVTPVNVTNGTVPSGTTYSWSAPSVTGGIAGGASGTNQSSIGGTLTNTTISNQTATYTVTPTKGSCTGATFTVTVTVYPKANISNITYSSCLSPYTFHCTPTNIINGLVPSGTTYIWDAPVINPIGSITGGSAQSTGQTYIGQTLSNGTTIIATATYIVTPTTGTCVGDTFTITVTLTPKPSVTSASADTICTGVAQNYTITSNISGTTYSWSRAAVAGISNAAANNQTGNPITETLINTTSAPINVIYLIKPTSNGCTGNTFTYIVTVKPRPSVSSSATGTVCSGVAENYNITCGVAGTTYTWSRAAVAGISNPAVSGQTSNPITEVLINTTTSPKSVIYLINPSATGCAGTQFTYTVIVTPKPVSSDINHN